MLRSVDGFQRVRFAWPPWRRRPGGVDAFKRSHVQRRDSSRGVPPPPPLPPPPCEAAAEAMLSWVGGDMAVGIQSVGHVRGSCRRPRRFALLIFFLHPSSSSSSVKPITMPHSRASAVVWSAPRGLRTRFVPLSCAWVCTCGGMSQF